MLNEFMEILEIDKKYKSSIVQAFKEELLKIDFSETPLEQLKLFNNIYFGYFKKCFIEEEKDSVKYLKFITKYSLDIKDISAITVSRKKQKNEIENVKNSYNSVKHELPQKLMFIYELFNESIAKGDGSFLTPKEYSDSSIYSLQELKEKYSDALSLINEKIEKLKIKNKES